MNKSYLEIYIKGSGFDFKSQGEIVSNFSIPLSIMDNMEILDPLGLEKLIKELIDGGKIKNGKCDLFLSNEIIFNKIVTSSEEEKNFFDKIPFEPENTVKTIVISGKEKIAIAVNKKFINDIKLILEKTGLEVISIVPETESLQELIDFNKNIDSEIVSDKEESKTSILKIALVIFIIVAIIALALFFFIKKPFVKITLVKETPSVIPISFPQSSSIPFLNKNEIKIQVLNKTKTSGLAKKVMDALSGFSNIEVGNIEVKETLITEVTFSSQIEESVREEINNVLISMFAEVASKEGELNDGFNILIELGKTSVRGN